MTFKVYFITSAVSLGTRFSWSFSSIMSRMHQYSPFFLTELAQLPVDVLFVIYTSFLFCP